MKKKTKTQRMSLFKPVKIQPITNLSWPQAKARFPLMKPYGDADGDGLKNFRDCKPFDRTRKGKKHDEEDDESYERLTPREKAIVEEGGYLGKDGW